MKPKQYACGFCEKAVASEKGWITGASTPHWLILICPICAQPTFFGDEDLQLPRPKLGAPVEHLPPEINAVFEEARTCTEHDCYTAAVMLCRKLLMNVAVDKGAQEGKRFVGYVKYMVEKGMVPLDVESALEKVKDLGNEANHAVTQRSESEAQTILRFLEIVLRMNYEYPRQLTGGPASPDSPSA
ncbi:DUF4145 domain-containing protein [bacterium]|nr:DUF4145 domain-containing protein [bacterium]